MGSRPLIVLGPKDAAAVLKEPGQECSHLRTLLKKRHGKLSEADCDRNSPQLEDMVSEESGWGGGPR